MYIAQTPRWASSPKECIRNIYLKPTELPTP
nr:MAG TPA: hypothetical protein [Microviridae sp.]